MRNVFRSIPFILVSSNHGTLIVNRNDFRMVDEQHGYGVGFQLLNSSSFDQGEIDFVLALLERLKAYHGNGVVAIDCGANIGVHTIEWAKLMHSWGHVLAFEAQERLFYALAGNIAINNCLNASAKFAAVGAECGIINIPEPNYLVPASYGSLELRQTPTTEFIGQPIDYSAAAARTVEQVSIDSFQFARVDFIKIDVEGMEMDVLMGAQSTLERCKPLLLIEVIKSNPDNIKRLLQTLGYVTYPIEINMLAAHASDPIRQHLKLDGNTLRLE
jgi:FkbM family methyltransferase